MLSEFNTDFSQRVVESPADAIWYPSPQVGVMRRPLDRKGAEIARATSVVRYAAGSYFPRHTHGGGEEILVLKGIFSDEHADYPAGHYLRNPPQSTHQPFSKTGCLLLVKLWQFQKDDQRSVVLDTARAPATDWQPASGVWTGVAQQFLLLHEYAGEQCAICQLPADYQTDTQEYPAGLEVFVLEGELHDASGCYVAGTWLRLPAGQTQAWFTLRKPARLYVKLGHLKDSRLMLR